MDFSLMLFIGYLFGSILWANILVKLLRNESIFEKGSKNPGTANTVKQYGKKIGALVLIGDILKTVVAILIARMIFDLNYTEIEITLVTGIGVILGHEFPVWTRFHGGKGVACMVTTLILADPRYGIFASVIGLMFVLFQLGLKSAAVVIPLCFYLLINYHHQNMLISALCLIILILIVLKNTPLTEKLFERHVL